MTTTATATVQHDDESLRVTRWDFEPGQSTGAHVHEYDYVVVPITDGRIEAIAPDGTTTPSDLVAGRSYVRVAGVEHEVINSGRSRLAFVEVETKRG